MLRFDLDSAQFTHAWLSMNDMVQPKESTLERYFTDLDDADYEYAKDMVEYYNSPDFVFSGRDMIPGAALSVIHATRDLTEKAKAQILNASDEYASNNAINGLFRPEIKIPRFLITGKFQKISSK